MFFCTIVYHMIIVQIQTHIIYEGEFRVITNVHTCFLFVFYEITKPEKISFLKHSFIQL